MVFINNIVEMLQKNLLSHSLQHLDGFFGANVAHGRMGHISFLQTCRPFCELYKSKTLKLIRQGQLVIQMDMHIINIQGWLQHKNDEDVLITLITRLILDSSMNKSIYKNY